MSRTWCGMAVAVAVTLCAAGCASVPTGGRVASGRVVERAEPVDDPYIRIIPVPPGRDWLPKQIVQGFLTASAGFDDGHAVARRYLAPNVVWKPDQRPSVTVYEGSLDISATGDSNESTQSSLRVHGSRLGGIQPDGQYAADQGPIDQIFQLAKNAQGQWRITVLPDTLRNGLLLGQRDVDRAFRTLNLYFFAPDGVVLVPNPIFLPLVKRRTLASQLVRAVVAGPTSWLKPAVRSEFPPGTQLLGEGVDITDGLATVNLSEQAARGSLSGMSAQLMWTLRQLPEVTRMRLQIDGHTVTPPSVGTTQTPYDWRGNNPDATRENAPQQAYLRDASGHFKRLSGDQAFRVYPTGSIRLYHPAISLDESSVAGLTKSGDTVLLGNIAGGTAPHPAMHAAGPKGHFTTPTWDRHGTLWTVENYGVRSRLWIKEQGKPARHDDNWGLAQSNVTALRIARDGVRAAAIVTDAKDAKIEIGRIVRSDADGTLNASFFLPVSSEIVDAMDLAWRNADELAVLGRQPQAQARAAYQVPVSGGPIELIGTGGGDMTSITAAPHSPVLVSAKGKVKGKGTDQICHQSDENDPISAWVCFAADHHDPAYPG